MVGSILAPILVEPLTGSIDMVCANRAARSLSVDPVGDSSSSDAGIIRFYR